MSNKKKFKISLLLIIIGLFSLLYYDCRNIDNYVFIKYYTHIAPGDCVVDLNDLPVVDWDSICFYSGTWSKKEIEYDLRESLITYNDVGDRMIYFYQGKQVYIKEWFPYPSDYDHFRVLFLNNSDKFTIYRDDAKFIVKKKGNVFILKK